MLELNKVCVSFRSERQDKIFGHTRQQVLFDVSLRVEKGTCLGILGESGSGKSTMGRVLCGLLKPDSGDVQLDGVSVYASRSGRRNLQNKLSVVFQDYTTSANPRFRVKEIIGEGLTVRERREGNKLDRDRETASLLELVGLPTDFATRFPHELSGGQLQRVCIARAVACKPEIILFDEAISSLDAHTQVQVMDLLRELKEKLGLLSLAFSGPAIVLHGILIGLGDTRSVLIANVIGNGVNVALNVLLIHGIGPFPALGVLGAGISTAIGTGVTLIFTLAIFLRKDHSASLRGYGTWLPQKNYLKMIAPLASGVFCEQAAERFGMFTFARLVANLGTSALGVHNICSGLCDILIKSRAPYVLTMASAKHAKEKIPSYKKEAIFLIASFFNFITFSFCPAAMRSCSAS